MKKLTFEIRSPAHQQNAIHAVQQILPDPTKPIVVTIQERNRSLDQNRKLWACLGDVSRQVEWHGRWLDDTQVVDYRVVKMPVVKGGKLELTITELGDE
ncbi:TPA: recombination protein NinB [Escherichia coli]